MSFIFSIKDTYRAAVEAATGGKNTVMYDDQGNPSIMVVIPKFFLDDVIPGAPHVVHPAFVVNNVEKSYIYVSKYQNIVQNNRAYSLPGQDPATYVTFDQALAYCYAKGQGWHLMTNAEWAAIALWCKKNGFIPRGNNYCGVDVSASYETGVKTYDWILNYNWNNRAYKNDGGNYYHVGRVATGSGPASWAHDVTNEGIFDLNGNVAEWQSGLRLNAGEIQVIPNNDAAIQNADHSASSTLWKAIASSDGSYVAPGTANTLKINGDVAGDNTQTDHRVGNPVLDIVRDKPAYTGGDVNDYFGNLNRSFETFTAATGITVPTIMKALGLFPIDGNCGGDILYVRNYGERLPLRGGDWSNGADAGVFYLALSIPRSNSSVGVGFRSAFVL